MPTIQKDFEDFHSKIKLDENDENAKLREKRDTLIKELRSPTAHREAETAKAHRG